MGFNFDAIVGKQPIKEEKAKRLGLPIIYEKEYAIIPLIEENVTHYSIEHAIDDKEFGDEIRFDYSSVHCIARELGLTDFVLIKSSYDGFRGSYYKQGVKQLHEVHIHEALMAFGAYSEEQAPFEYLNLNTYRQSEVYYWSDGFTQPDHIIKGEVLIPDYSKDIDEEIN